MPRPTYDKKESIPQGFEEEYEELDGKWAPIDGTAKLRKALAEEKDAREKAEAVAKKAAKAAADAEAKKAATAAGMSEAELKKIYDGIEANLRAEYEPKIAELEKHKGEVRTLKLNDKVKAAFAEHGAFKSRLDDLWKLHGEEFDLTSDGKPMVKDEPGKDVVKHVQKILAGRTDWVQGTKATGSGSGFTSTTAAKKGGSNAEGLSFDDMVKNPGLAIAAANEG